MTQESPLLLCYDCRTPTDVPPPVAVKGEPYCEDCGPDAVKRAF